MSLAQPASQPLGTQEPTGVCWCPVGMPTLLPHTGGKCLKAQRTATGKADGRAEFSLLAKQCSVTNWAVLQSLFPKTVTLVLECIWALGSVKVWLPMPVWVQEDAHRVTDLGAAASGCHTERMPHLLSRADPRALVQATGQLCCRSGEGRLGRCLFLNLLGQECSMACQGSAELASAPSCWVLLLSPPSSSFVPNPLTLEDADDKDDSNC